MPRAICSHSDGDDSAVQFFEVWEDSLPRPRREETAVEQPADADVQECTVRAPLGNFSSDALTLASLAEFADSEA